jgi:hypothetical protein
MTKSLGWRSGEEDVVRIELEFGEHNQTHLTSSQSKSSGADVDALAPSRRVTARTRFGRYKNLLWKDRRLVCLER